MPATKQNTTESAKHKLSLIRLAEELGNVSKACEITGYSRQSFYDIRRRAFQVDGMAAFVEKKARFEEPNYFCGLAILHRFLSIGSILRKRSRVTEGASKDNIVSFINVCAAEFLCLCSVSNSDLS